MISRAIVTCHPSYPKITVAICTRNRAHQLASVLTSAERLEVASGLSWELLVVDNGSSDDTEQVVASFADRLPIRCVREEEPGLSNARNRAVAEARGAYICWTDDDVEVDPHWLAAYAAAFRDHPEAAIFGGAIIPKLEPPTPHWFAKASKSWPLTNLLAARNPAGDQQPLGLTGGRIPWGANFAVRRAEQLEHLYDPLLGVSPKIKRLGEESEVIYRILEDGAVGWWVPDAKVTHVIPAKRQSWEYVYEYFYASGETIAYLEEARPGRNHVRPDPSVKPVLPGSATLLRALSVLERILFRLTRACGLTRRSLYHLRKRAVYDGAAAYLDSRPSLREAESRPSAIP